jgi:hypothetical protein
MVMQVAAVHQIQNETELVGRVKRVRHAHYERTVLPCTHEGEHDAFVQRQRLSLLHFYPLLVQTLHGVHLPGVGLPTTVNLAEAASPYYSVHAEVVHRQLRKRNELRPRREINFLRKIFIQDPPPLSKEHGTALPNRKHREIQKIS